MAGDPTAAAAGRSTGAGCRHRRDAAWPGGASSPAGVASRVTSATAGSAGPVPDRAGRQWLQDPNRIYTEAVQRAIIDAMIDYARRCCIRPDEWLTVAARDNVPRDTLAPQDPFEEIVTILLRIKGADLAAYRAGQIDRRRGAEAGPDPGVLARLRLRPRERRRGSAPPRAGSDSFARRRRGEGTFSGSGVRMRA